MGEKYCRIQVNLEKAFALDDTEKSSIDALEKAAILPDVQQNRAIDWLTKNFA